MKTIRSGQRIFTIWNQEFRWNRQKQYWEVRVIHPNKVKQDRWRKATVPAKEHMRTVKDNSNGTDA